MNKLKLDPRGFIHDILLVVIMLVVAIGGVGLLVASHADSCPTTASGPVSGSHCTVMSGPDVPEPNQPPETIPDTYNPLNTTISYTYITVNQNDTFTYNQYSGADSTKTATPKAKCMITGVPKKPKHSQTVYPVLTVKNTGKVAFKNVGAVGFKTYNNKGKTVINHGGQYANGTSADLINVKGTYKIKLLKYTVGYKRDFKVKGKFIADGASSSAFSDSGLDKSAPSHYHCSASFTYPTPPKHKK